MISSLNSCQIVAVVVTYNRLNLLRECVDALRKQTRKPDWIIVINNGSTDGTKEWLQSQEDVQAVNQTNCGGAGGFHTGTKIAFQHGEDWIWLMDDDAVPTLTALEELLATYNRWPDEKDRPQLLASKVIWTDGSLHPMNIPLIWTKDQERWVDCVAKCAFPIRSCSFVSVMFRRTMVERYGLPIVDYFIWNDDLEYTSRILKNEYGVLVARSVVWHKTGRKYTPVESSGQRFYYEIRNKLWLIRWSDALASREKFKYIPYLRKAIRKYLKHHHFCWDSFVLVTRGIWDGVFKKPKENPQ